MLIKEQNMRPTISQVLEENVLKEHKDMLVLHSNDTNIPPERPENFIIDFETFVCFAQKRVVEFYSTKGKRKLTENLFGTVTYCEKISNNHIAIACSTDEAD